MKKFIKIASIVFICLFTLLFGRVEKEIVDDVNIVLSVAFDKAEGEKIKGTAVIPVFNADKSIDNATFTGESVLAKEIINVLQKKSADPLVTGTIKSVIYGEDLARKGILRYIDALIRDASIGSKMYVGIVEGKAGKVLEKNLGNRGTGEYVETILEHNIERRDVPKSDLHTFLFRNYADGMDPYLPIMKLLEDKVQINGLGMFHEGKLVYKISESDMFFFKAMVENYGEGSYTLNLKDSNEYASVKRISTSRKIKVEKLASGKPEVNISIKFKGILSEYSGAKTDPAIIEKIVKQLEDTIVDKSEEMLNNFRDRNIDPVGIGYLARHSNRNFDQKKWGDSYKNIKIEVHSKVILTETGIIE